MAKVFLGVGSNIDPARHLRLAVAELSRRFGEITRSAVYRNPPVGFSGDDFLNMVVMLRSSLGPRAILGELEEIHEIAGRTSQRRDERSRELDIDLLLYDGPVSGDVSGIELPRRDVLEYDFVLRPLAELAPALVHPETGRNLADHWREKAVNSREMTREAIEFV